MLHVEITNYKTIKHVKFDIDKYTAFLGRNFIGKTAILSAIRSCLENRTGSGFIRDFESYCEVRIIFQKPEINIDIFWHKEEGNTYYEIDGVRYDKIGNGPPPAPIVEAGLYPIFFGDRSVDLMFSEQGSPLFLVHEQKSDYVTELLAMIYNLDVIHKADDLAKKAMRSLNAEVKIREKDVKSEELSLREFDGMGPAKDSLELVRSELTQLQEDNDYVISVESLVTEADALKHTLDVLSQKVDGVSIPEIPDVAQVLRDIDDVSGWLSISENLLPCTKVSTKGLKIPKLDLLQEELNKAEELTDTLRDASTANKARKHLSRLIGLTIPNMGDLVSTISEVDLLSDAIKKASAARSTAKELSPISSVAIPLIPEVGGVLTLDSLVSELLIAKKNAAQLKSVSELNVPNVDFNADEIEMLEGLIVSARKANQEYKSLLPIKDVSLPQIDFDADHIKMVEKMIEEMESSVAQKLSAEKEVSIQTLEIETVTQLLSEFKECPLCGKENK